MDILTILSSITAPLIYFHGLTLGALGDEVEGAVLAAQVLAGSVDPHIGGLDDVLLQRQRQVAVEDRLVDARIGRVLQDPTGHTALAIRAPKKKVEWIRNKQCSFGTRVGLYLFFGS